MVYQCKQLGYNIKGEEVWGIRSSLGAVETQNVQGVLLIIYGTWTKLRVEASRVPP